jgi:hypothetical protein
LALQKTHTSTIIKRLVIEKYSFDSGVREHILKMSNMTSKLKSMDMGLKDEFLVNLVMSSLPKEFETFEINYNFQPESWGIEKLIVMCVQEEEMIKEALPCAFRRRGLRRRVVILSTT